jgi:hypothetical protein
LVLEGEQCLETMSSAIRKHAGEGAIVAAGETMRMVSSILVTLRKLSNFKGRVKLLRGHGAL